MFLMPCTSFDLLEEGICFLLLVVDGQLVLGYGFARGNTSSAINKINRSFIVDYTWKNLNGWGEVQ